MAPTDWGATSCLDHQDRADLDIWLIFCDEKLIMSLMRTFMRSGVYIILVTVCLLSTPSYGQNRSDPNQRTIKVGVIAGLTGEYAAVFQNWTNGITLAAELYARSGKQPAVELTLEDDGFSPTKGLSAYRKLLEINHVDALLNGSSATIGAISSLVTKEAFPVIQLGEEAVDPADDNIIQIMPGNIASEIALGKELAKLYPTGVVLFTTSNSTMIRFATAFKVGYGLSLTEFQMDPQTTDFKPLILSARSHKPRCIVVLAFPPQGALLVKQARQLIKGEITFAFDGSFKTGLSEYQKLLGDLTFLDESLVVTITSETTKSFTDAYRARFKELPGPCADLGFDAFNVLVSKYASSAAKWTASIKSARQDGASGQIVFDQVGVRIPAFRMMKIKELTKSNFIM